MTNAIVVLQMKQNVNIEDPRNHSPESMVRLHHLLATGVSARPDANRSDFFEIEDGDQVFYIHLSPVTGRVILLATWTRRGSNGGGSSLS